MSEAVEVLVAWLEGLLQYLSWGNVKILAGAVVLVWVLVEANRRLGLLDLVSGLFRSLFGRQVASLQARGEAVAAEKAGDHLAAGLAYDKLGDWEKALDCYEFAGEYHLAGELCVRLGHKEVAAEWFLLSDEKLRAASLYRELGKHAEAAEAYLKAGATLEAASELVEAGKFAEAAAIYERSGNLLRAAEAFERGGDLERAGDCFARQVTELLGRGSHYRSASQEAELARLCHRAGRAFEKAGALERAIDLYERGGQLRPAAQLAEKLGQDRRAAELYRRLGATDKAAELYERAGNARAAANLVGDEKLSGGDAIAAAEAFARGGDSLRAAEVLESAGHFERAAAAYEGAGAFREAAEAALRGAAKGRAAELFVKAGEPEKAAELYFELGDFDLASLLFAKSNRFFDAAKAAAQANSESKMVDYLQQVPASDPNGFTAAIELARAFERRGWSSIAREKLRTVLAGKEVVRDNLELWDELAKAEEAEGHLEESAAILLRIMAVSVGYRGAQERHEALKRRIAEEKTRAETIRSAPITRAPAASTNGRRYEVTGMLGRGGMGAVYKAYDHLLKRHVAYKVLADSLAGDRTARDQLLEEARAAAALNHPNIVTVYDLGFDGDDAFICMELVEGESFRAILRKRTRIETADAMHWLVSVCQGLDHAHGRGIVHRDMKPSNVLLATDRRVKILDFGLARAAAHSDGAEQWVNSMSGTPKYISPEAIQGRPADARSDVYSVGATLYELLAGRPPFTEGNLLVHHLHTPPPPLAPLREEIDPKLEELVMLCLAKAPEDRFQSAGEILSFAAAAKLL